CFNGVLHLRRRRLPYFGQHASVALAALLARRRLALDPFAVDEEFGLLRHVCPHFAESGYWSARRAGDRAAQIEMADLGIAQDLVVSPFEADATALHDDAVIGDAQARARILLYQQHSLASVTHGFYGFHDLL